MSGLFAAVKWYECLPDLLDSSVPYSVNVTNEAEVELKVMRCNSIVVQCNPGVFKKICKLVYQLGTRAEIWSQHF